VVNIGSVSGVLVTPFAGAYCASKAAVHALSDALRMELAPFAIGVLEVQPGAIASSFGAHASQQAEQLLEQASPWWPIRDGIRARANASQDNPTPASHFARNVLAAVQSKQHPDLLRLGNGSRIMPLLAALVPKRLLQAALKKRFGLDRSL
jgi:short-subunit dehydrogenase